MKNPYVLMLIILVMITLIGIAICHSASHHDHRIIAPARFGVSATP